MAAFIVSSFGLFVMGLFARTLHGPLVANLHCCWRVAGPWPVGSATPSRPICGSPGRRRVKHFSRFYGFLGGALYQARWQLWARIIRCAAQWVPAGDADCDRSRRLDQEKSGAPDRGGGPLSQRRGLGPPRISHAARAQLCVGAACASRCPAGQARVSVCPSACRSTSKKSKRASCSVPYQSRSALAREIVDFVAAQLPTRQIRVLGDGGYATKDYLHQLPATVDVVSRMLITGKLYAPPPRRDRPAPGVSAEERPAAGVAENLGPQTVRLAAPSHRSRGARPSVDGAVAYRACRGG